MEPNIKVSRVLVDGKLRNKEESLAGFVADNGAKQLQNTAMPTLRIKKENENLPHFITMTTIGWLDIFTKKEYSEAIINCLKYSRANLGLLLYEYVIMTNHVHLIAAAAEGKYLSNIIASVKRYTTAEILNLLRADNRCYISDVLKLHNVGRDGFPINVWQRENYPEVIIANKFYEKHMEYIHNNPVRKGYVANAQDWTYSSAGYRYLGDKSVIDLDNLAT
jgi:putative transposase